jgi:hypothetical protein
MVSMSAPVICPSDTFFWNPFRIQEDNPLCEKAKWVNRLALGFITLAAVGTGIAIAMTPIPWAVALGIGLGVSLSGLVFAAWKTRRLYQEHQARCHTPQYQAAFTYAQIFVGWIVCTE